MVENVEQIATSLGQFLIEANTEMSSTSYDNHTIPIPNDSPMPISPLVDLTATSTFSLRSLAVIFAKLIPHFVLPNSTYPPNYLPPLHTAFSATATSLL